MKRASEINNPITKTLETMRPMNDIYTAMTKATESIQPVDALHAAMAQVTESIRPVDTVHDAMAKTIESILPTDAMHAMAKMSEAMRPSNDMYAAIIKASETMRPMSDMYASMAKASEVVYPVSNMYAAIVKASETMRPMSDMYASMAKASEVVYPVSNMYAAIVKASEAMRPMSDVYASMAKAPDSIWETVKKEQAFKDIFAPSGAFASAFQVIQNKNIYLNPDFTTNISALAGNLAAEDIQIENDGRLSLGSQSSTLSEISFEIDAFFQAIAKEVSVQKILSLLSNLQKPAKQIVVWIFSSLILPILINIAYDYYKSDIQNYLNSISLNSNHDFKHAIKKIPQEIHFSTTVGHRVVLIQNLSLRSSPNMQSTVIEKLGRGKLVRVIQKKRNWTKVEVELSDSGDKCVGWVLTRYIVHIKR